MMEELQRRLARDINCLKDNDRMKRKSGLRALSQIIPKEEESPLDDEDSRAVGQLFCETQVGELLIQLLTDSVERIRESSIDVLESFLRIPYVRENLHKFAQQILRAIKQQVGEKPFNEPAEELRLRYVQLLRKLVEEPACQDMIRSEFDDVIYLIDNASQDTFPKTKQECAKVVESLVNGYSNCIHRNLSGILKPQLDNFVHQRSAVRLAALKAVSTSLRCCQEAGTTVLKENVIPKFNMLLFDRSPTVRKELGAVAVSLLAQVPPSVLEDCCTSLEYICLSLHADDTDEVAQMSHDTFQNKASAMFENLVKPQGKSESELSADEKVAAEAASQNGQSATDEDIEMYNSHVNPEEDPEFDVELPPPFSKRPSKLSRQVVIQNLSPLVQLATSGLLEWTVSLRKAAVCALRSLLIYAEDHITAYVNQIISTLCRAVQDEEVSVRDLAHDCNALVGAYVPPDGQLGVLLPLIHGELSGLTEPSHKYQGIIVLCDTISGMNFQQVQHHLIDISRTLSDPELVNTEVYEMPEALYYAVEAIIDVARQSLCDSSCRCYIGRALVNLHREDVPRHLHDKAQQQLRQLADLSTCGTVCEMLSKDLHPFLEAELSRREEWTKADGGRMFFDAIVRHYPPVLRHLGAQLVEAFRLCADVKRERELRLEMMGLLDMLLKACDIDGYDSTRSSLFSLEEVKHLHEATQENILHFLKDIIQPNLVWRPGGVASAMRKIASSAFLSALRSKLISPSVVRECWNSMQQQVLSVLADDDSVTRQIVSMLLQLIFESGQGILLDMQATRDVYPELIKRLDDSNDTVRQLICETLQAFLRASTKENLQGGPIDHTIDSLLVHMDDPEPHLQQYCFQALCEFAKFDPEYASKKASEARQKHRSPTYCDKLLQLCQQLQASEGK